MSDLIKTKERMASKIKNYAVVLRLVFNVKGTAPTNIVAIPFISMLRPFYFSETFDVNGYFRLLISVIRAFIVPTLIGDSI